MLGLVMFGLYVRLKGFGFWSWLFRKRAWEGTQAVNQSQNLGPKRSVEEMLNYNERGECTMRWLRKASMLLFNLITSGS